MKTQRLALLTAAVVALMPPPLVSAAESNPGTALPIVHRYAVGERFVYDSNVLIAGATLRQKEHSRYTFDVNAKDEAKGLLRIERNGRTDPPIEISIRPDGTWARPDGRTVPVLTGFDPAFMCKHDGLVHAGETWECRIEGVSQYLGGAIADPGDVHVAVTRIVTPTSLELRVSFRGQPHTETVLDEDTHQEVHIVKQSLRTTNIVLRDGIATSITSHTKISTQLPGLTSVLDITGSKTLVEHRT